MTAFDFVSIGLLLTFAVANWWVPRRLGTAGTVLVHVALLVAYFALSAYAMNTGRFEYDGLPTMVSMLVVPFALNCLLLPIALVALWRHSAEQRRLRRPFLGRGSPVAAASPDAKQ